MGEIRKYACKCGYEKDIYAGGGLSGCNLNFIAKFFPDEMDFFQKEREAGKIENYIMENELLFCPECGDIMAVPVFSYTRTDGRTSRFIGSCPVCGGIAEQLADEDHIQCPNCGEKMEYAVTGDWD